MFRKYSFALIALVTTATPIALATSANAIPIDIAINGPKNFPKPWPKPWPHPHWRPNPVIVVERPYVQPMVSQPVVRNVTRVVSQPTPRTADCLTKQYTPNGFVVFKDLCTKETASAALPGSAAAMQTQQQQMQVAPQVTAPQGAAPVTQNQNTTNTQQIATQPAVKN